MSKTFTLVLCGRKEGLKGGKIQDQRPMLLPMELMEVRPAGAGIGKNLGELEEELMDFKR